MRFPALCFLVFSLCCVVLAFLEPQHRWSHLAEIPLVAGGFGVGLLFRRGRARARRPARSAPAQEGGA